jgi:hypothetical protein
MMAISRAESTILFRCLKCRVIQGVAKPKRLVN